MSGMKASRQPTREILALAVPAFLALVAEPLYLLVDSMILGHVGTAQLAALGVASAILVTATGLFVFLAYGTTSVVAHQVGAGKQRAALSSSLDGIWLALALGVVAGLVVWLAAEPLCAAFGASPEVLAYATSYLSISAAGIPSMLVGLAAVGALRGLQDTRTPLIASVAGFGTNIVLNLWFVLGLGWGLPGAAQGTVIAQTLLAIVLVTVVLRRALAEEAELRPAPLRILRTAQVGLPLLIRTLALRAILLLTTWVAAGFGDAALAAHQVAGTVWTFQAFALDALAIAAQAITGKELGAENSDGAREASQIMLRWGSRSGLALGLLLIMFHRLLPPMFTPDPEVQAALAAALLIVGASGWLCGLVFVADGVLIGAGDGKWLAKAMTWTLLLYLPLVLLVHLLTPALSRAGAPIALAVLWIAFTAFLAIRWGFLRHRLRQEDWLNPVLLRRLAN